MIDPETEITLPRKAVSFPNLNIRSGNISSFLLLLEVFVESGIQSKHQIVHQLGIDYLPG